jgi:NAD(P)-dependent dehydrogenase (short-subunit alcohol dehydrogenase family)
VITGASRNIGSAIAREFALAGADLVVSSRTRSDLDDIAADLRQRSGRRVVPVAADVSDTDAMAELAAQTLGAFDRVDVVVNNALLVAKSPLLAQPEARSVVTAPRALWEEGFDGYIHGPMRLLHGLLPAMPDPGGSVINVISTAGFRIVDGLGVYGVTKAAMWSLTRYLAAELAPGIRVNALCPGTTSPDGEVEVEAHRPLLEKVPMKRMGAATEAAKAALFLAGDASSYTTGQVLFVDGGRVALT